MKTKRSPSAVIESKRFLFFETGLIITLLLVLCAFEWKTGNRSSSLPSFTEISGAHELPPPVTKQRELVKPPPLPVFEFEILDNTLAESPVFEYPDLEAFADTYRPVMLAKEEDPEEIHDFVEIMPRFRNKEAGEFMKFIYEHITYPERAIVNQAQGVVYVKFIIDRDGRLINPEIVRGVDPDLDQEVLRVVTMSERWSPGIQNLKRVKVSFTMPVRFNLQ